MIGTRQTELHWSWYTDPDQIQLDWILLLILANNVYLILKKKYINTYEEPEVLSARDKRNVKLFTNHCYGLQNKGKNNFKKLSRLKKKNFLNKNSLIFL